MAIVGRNKTRSSSTGGGSGGVSKSSKSGRFLSGVSMKKPGSPLRKSRKNLSTPAAEEPSTHMKVAIVSRNRATETTPATAAPTPGLDSYMGDMVSSALDYASAPLEACGILEKGKAGEESAASQLSKVRSGQRVQGQKFAKAPIWGIAPVLSDDDDTVGRSSDVGEYDDVELVLQQTPERGGAGTATDGGVETPDNGSPSANLAGAMEAEAQRQQQQQMEQDEVVSAARKNLLKSKEESRTRQAAARAAAASSSSRPISSAASTNAASAAPTEDFVDASVASALETWRSATDPATGRTYYYNRVTKETKWDPPPELVDAYRSVVAKKGAMQNSKGAGIGAGTTTAAGGAAVFGAAAVAAANANNESDANTTQSTNKSALSKGGKSIRKMLGMGKKGHGKTKDAPAATSNEATTADQAVLNGMAAANEELPDDELTDLGLTPTRTFSNVEVVQGAEGEVSIERSGSNVSHSKKNLGMMAAVHALRTRTRSLNKHHGNKSSAAASGGKSKKKKERVHGWRSVVDDNSGKTYYYHTLTKETRWDKPEDYDEALDARRSKSKKKNRSKKDPAGASSSTKPRRAIWKEAVDQKSGKTYFYHTITKEVTWVKPAGFDEQQEALKKEKEERQRKRAEAKERKRAALASSGGGPAFDPVNLELQKALASALPDQQKQHDELLEKYKGKEDDLLTALEELQEDTPFDECIEYDAVLTKMDQIEARKSGNVLALAGAAVSAAAVSTQPPSRMDAPSIGRTYSTYTSGTGMRSELTQRVNNVTKSISPGVAPIAEDGEDDDETSISSKAEEMVGTAAASAKGGGNAALQQTSEAVRTRSQRSNRSGMAARPAEEESYTADHEHADQYSVSDSVSALSTDIEYAGIRARQERRQKKALGAAMEEKDWNKAATVAQELSKRERSDDSNQRYSARYRASPARPARKSSSASDKEFNQSELDQYIAKNDWNSVAQYIAVMRSASQDDRDNKRQPRSSRDGRSHASASYGGSHYSESTGMPRKQVGARSQLQFSHSYDESEYSDEWETDSQATEGSDWESYTSGPQGPPSYYSNRDTRERRRNDNAPADVPKRKMQV